MLKAAVVGVGKRAAAHIQTLKKLEGLYSLIAFYDLDRNRLNTVTKELNVRAYTDFKAMLEEAKPDVALVAVGPEGHNVLTKPLMEAGVHVLSETPIAMTMSCARQMMDVAKENKVVLEVAENVPRWPKERLKQRLKSTGVLGGLKSFYLSYTSGSYHGMAAIRSLLGSEASNVSLGEFPEPDTVLERASLGFPGVKGVYESNRSRGNYWEIHGEKASLRGGELDLEGVKHPLKVEYAEREGASILRRVGVELKPPLYWDNPFKAYSLNSEDDVARADAWISLYNAVVHGGKPDYGAENAVKDLELLIAVRESAMRGGAEIRLPLSKDTSYEENIHRQFTQVYGVDPLNTTVKDLKVQYTLPDVLSQLLYYGRVTKSPT